MAASRKLDEAVAFHVLDWGNVEGRWHAPGSDDSPGTENAHELPAFSADLNAAWKVVDRVCEGGFRLQLDGSRLWLARFYKSAAHTLETKAVSATAGHPAEAICLAALTMKGIDFTSMQASAKTSKTGKR